MKQILAWLTLLLTASFVLSPAFTSPFSGFRADQLPFPQIDPPIQPAGYAFSIWGLIYGWLIVSAVFGILRRADDAGWDRARMPLILSLALGAPWLAVANTSAIWATLLIFVMSATAIAALLCTPNHDRWWLRAPVAIYAGWLTAASFVSLGSTAAGYGILFDSIGWAYAGIIGALALGLLVQRNAANAPEYGATLIWALVGIIIGNGLTLNPVTLLAVAGVAIIAIATLLFNRNAKPA